jgi:surfeit locus 1 family protein
VRFHAPLRATLTLLPLAVACAWLGLWQWQRMHDKEALLAQFERAPERGYADATAEGVPFARVRLTGSYTRAWHVLRDNRIENGQTGVHVLTLFRPDSGTPILVNRGWLPLAPDRRSLPRVPTPPGRVSISGMLAPPPEERVQLGGPDRFDRLKGPTLITYFDLDRMVAELDMELSSSLLLLDAGDATGFGSREWKPAVMLPAQHQAYAVQWFALAAAALIIWLCLGCRRRTPPSAHARRTNRGPDGDRA